MGFWKMQPTNKVIPHEIAGKAWEIGGTDIYSLSNSVILCIVDYHSKFPIIGRAEGLAGEQLIRYCKIVFADYRLPCEIISDAGINFV